jgi:hypothetical protein
MGVESGMASENAAVRYVLVGVLVLAVRQNLSLVLKHHW